MSETRLNVMAVVGSLRRDSVTRQVILYTAEAFKNAGCNVHVIDLAELPLPLFSPDTCHQVPGFEGLKTQAAQADVFVLGTPDYHGGASGALKNFLDYFWHEFAGKLFVTLVASHEKGLTVVDDLRTIARQCYAWSLPYGISFAEGTDVLANGSFTEKLSSRLAMVVRDARAYGELLAWQRRYDLDCDEVGFLARHRE